MFVEEGGGGEDEDADSRGGQGKDVGSRALWQYFDDGTAVRI